MIVCKFGGSSIDGAGGIARVAGLVRARLGARPIVVVSAMGKTTRQLLQAAEGAAAGDLSQAQADVAALRQMHWSEAAAAVPPAARPALAAALDPTFAALDRLLERVARERRLDPRDADAAAACGEVLASQILALALPAWGVAAAWIDSRQVMVTDDTFTRARPLYDETGARLRAALLPAVERGAVPVLGGYIGATRDGVVTTLGKEGSDFTAAIVGAAVGADEIQIWTDVDGILTADPRLVPAARPVAALSFGESLELACSGAKKPHPGTLGPASRAGVPIRILNTLAPHVAGTLIGPRGAGPAAQRPAVRSLACRTNDFLLFVAAPPATAAGEDGGAFAAGIAAAVERLRPALLVVRLDAAGAQLALAGGDRLDQARQALAAATGRGVDSVGVASGRAVLSLVSDDFATDAALAARTLEAAAALQPHLVFAGTAAPAVRCLIEEEDMPAVAAALHHRLFAAGPAADAADAADSAASTAAPAAAAAAAPRPGREQVPA